MQRNVVKIRINPKIKEDAIWLANARGVTLNELVQEALIGEFARDRSAERCNQTDKQLLANLTDLLSHEFNQAGNWEDLAERLKNKGFILRALGREIALCKWPSGTRICSANDLGFSYTQLLRRMGSAFPWMAKTQNYSRFKTITPPSNPKSEGGGDYPYASLLER
ncbi:MAG: hypothetical protein AAGA97_06600 [Pseudomonadota bacterium]